MYNIFIKKEGSLAFLKNITIIIYPSKDFKCLRETKLKIERIAPVTIPNKETASPVDGK